MPVEDRIPDTPTVTVYWYSQTGQLKEALTAFVAPLEKAGWAVDWVEVAPRTAFPFPWPVGRFFGAFPASVDPAPRVDLLPVEVPETPADLVVLGFQVWYLAPSLPVRGLLAAHPEAFAGRDVLGVVACRNMWFSAALEVRDGLTRTGARYLGTVAAIDTSPTLATIVTTLRWLLLGRRDAFWRVFPRAGVGEDELERLRRLGEALAEEPREGDATPAAAVTRVLTGGDPVAAVVPPPIAAADLLAGRAFRWWGRAVRTVPGGGPARAALLGVFVLTLGAGIAVGLPAVVVLRLAGRGRFDAAVARRMAPALGGAAR